MPMTTPEANDESSTAAPPVTRLVSVTGAVEPAATGDVEQKFGGRGFSSGSTWRAPTQGGSRSSVTASTWTRPRRPRR